MKNSNPSETEIPWTTWLLLPIWMVVVIVSVVSFQFSLGAPQIESGSNIWRDQTLMPHFGQFASSDEKPNSGNNGTGTK